MKGRYDPDRPMQGRLWENPRDVNYAIPTVNGRDVSWAPDGRRRLRGRLGFRGRNGS